MAKGKKKPYIFISRAGENAEDGLRIADFLHDAGIGLSSKKKIFFQVTAFRIS